MPKFIVPQKLKIQKRGGMELIETLCRIVKAGKHGVAVGYGCAGFNSDRILATLESFKLIQKGERLKDQSPQQKKAYREGLNAATRMVNDLHQAKSVEAIHRVIKKYRQDNGWDPMAHALHNAPSMTTVYVATADGKRVCDEAEVTLVSGEPEAYF